jgi:hypothetical protein
MPGSFDYEPDTTPLDGTAPIIGVYLYDPQSGYTPLPNVQLLNIQQVEGTPPAARFAYLLDDAAAAQGYPSELEDLWPLTLPGNPYVLRYEDRVAAVMHLPNGVNKVLFDGFIQNAQADLAPGELHASVSAVSVAIRCWDNPILGRLERNADNPQAGKVVSIDHSIRFNPDGHPNCTPDGYDVNESDATTAYPVFLDHRLKRTPDPRAFWTLDKLVRYLLSAHNDEAYVTNPDFDGLSDLLDNRTPKPGTDIYDPSAPSTYDANPIVIRDFDASGASWPDALATQLEYAGFGLKFATEEDGDGFPITRLSIYRKDAGQAVAKQIHLPPRGSNLDNSVADTRQLSITRDGLSLRNAAVVEVERPRIEISVVLAPGYAPAVGDESAAHRIQFLRTNLGGASGTTRAKYRDYVADEAGDGHWDFGTNSWITDAFDFSAIFPADGNRNPTYARRLRPGSHSLISRDTLDRPLKAQLFLSRDYAGKSPALWDGSGTWQPISGGWRLMEDRLGIEVTAEDPNNWAIGTYMGPNPQEPSPTLRGITSQANPFGANHRFWLRLTTVIEADKAENAIAGPREASPTQFQRYAHADGRDHFRVTKIAAHSQYNASNNTVVVRDDNKLALAHAEQLRSVNEFPTTAGAIVLPGIVLSIGVGDSIDSIAGRDISFQTNAGIEQGEKPAFPVVHAVSWSIQGDEMSTTLQLSDRRAEPKF